MKTSKKIWAACFAFSSLLTLNTNAQWYGQDTYKHDSIILSSARVTYNDPGYVMAGFRPVRPSSFTLPDFVIDKVDVNGNITGFPEFSINYRILSDYCNGGAYTFVKNCAGISIIETSGPNGEAYAIVGAFDRGIFFATLDATGMVINRNCWIFPFQEINGRKPTIREVSSGGEYFISGHFASRGYVMRVDQAGNQVWGNEYSGALQPRDLVESSNGLELIVVGVCEDGNNGAANALFMSLDPNNGNVNFTRHYNLNNWDSDDWFSCIEIANSPTGGRGYVLGGRSHKGSSGLMYRSWVCKLDQAGNVIWTSLIETSAKSPGLVEGEEISRVVERNNPNSGLHEYYAVTNSNYFFQGGTLIPRKNLVVYKLDDNGGNSLGPNNEFHYIAGGYAPSAPIGTSALCFADIRLIETGGGPDDGFQAFGSFPSNAGYHYFVKSYFNGVSGCLESPLKIAAIHHGPDDWGMHQVYVNPISPCGPSSVQFNLIVPGVQANPLCWNSSVPGGSNMRVTGIQAQTKGQNGVSLYPNPTDRMLTVSAPAGSAVMIYNVLGEKVGEYTLGKEEGKLEIDLGALSIKPGVYSVQVTTGSSKNTYKVIYGSN